MSSSSPVTSTMPTPISAYPVEPSSAAPHSAEPSSAFAGATPVRAPLLTPISVQTSSVLRTPTQSLASPPGHRLIPLAPNMAVLLARLLQQPFYEMAGTRPEMRSTTERSDSLSALMKILHDQATHDGFRIITINAEPKRAILACNRQGKPPASSPSSDTASTASSDSAQDARNSRLGHSRRCGCRCRININYHSKLNAWRVTSFEANHNHTLDKPNVAVNPEESDYQVSPDMIKRAIERYTQAHTPTESPERSAILALTSLRSPMPRIEHPQPLAVSSQRRASILSTGSDPSEHLSTGSPSSPYVRRGSHGRLFIRRPSLYGNAGQQTHQVVALTPLSMTTQGVHSMMTQHPRPSAHPTNRSPMQQQLQLAQPRSAVTAASGTPSSSTSSESFRAFKAMAGTAIELDRYAMLHDAVKRLISTACKRRQWTEEVLSGVGRFLEQFSEGNPTATTPFSPAPSSFRNNTAATVTATPSANKDVMVEEAIAPAVQEEQAMEVDEPAVQVEALAPVSSKRAHLHADEDEETVGLPSPDKRQRMDMEDRRDVM